MQNPKPTTAKRQLRAFYTAQGLQGQAHRHAVRADMKKVRKNAGASFDGAHRQGMGFDAMFEFTGAPEGPLYWVARVRVAGWSQ